VDITVSSRHTDLSDRLQQSARDKVGRLSRYLSDLERADVHFAEEQNPRIADREICEVTVHGPGHQFHTRVRAAHSIAALDAAVDKLEHQVRRTKDRRARY
jgi:putative sigma-54 modulation protein